MQLGSSFRALPPVTKNLLIINVIVWAFLNLVPSTTSAKAEQLGALHYFTSSDFNPAQLVTYMFMHKSFMHLFFNMFALFMFGMVIERVVGSARFIFYYVSCGIGAALIQMGVFAVMISNLESQIPADMLPSVLETIHSEGAAIMSQGMNYAAPIIGELNALINIPVIGASGAIFGVLLAFGFMFPRQPLYMMFIPVPIQARWFVMGYAAIELLQGISNQAGDNVAHFAHLGGMVIGLLILLYWKKKGVITINRF